MKKLFFAISIILTMNTYSADYSNWAVPTSIELVSSGVLIHGNFGDPNNCGKPGFIFVSQSDPTYDSVLSLSLAALAAGKEIRAYSSRCTTISFHWSGQVINQHQNGQAFFIR